MDIINELFGGALDLGRLDPRKYEDELNKLYWTDPKYYMYRVGKLKEAGYKIYRNSAGKHKVKAGGYYY